MKWLALVFFALCFACCPQTGVVYQSSPPTGSLWTNIGDARGDDGVGSTAEHPVNGFTNRLWLCKNCITSEVPAQVRLRYRARSLGHTTCTVQFMGWRRANGDLDNTATIQLQTATDEWGDYEFVTDVLSPTDIKSHRFELFINSSRSLLTLGYSAVEVDGMVAEVVE